MYGLYVFQNNFFKPNTRTEKRALTRAQKRSTRTRTRTLRIQGEVHGEVTYLQVDACIYIVHEYWYSLQSIFVSPVSCDTVLHNNVQLGLPIC